MKSMTYASILMPHILAKDARFTVRFTGFVPDSGLYRRSVFATFSTVRPPM